MRKFGGTKKAKPVGGVKAAPSAKAAPKMTEAQERMANARAARAGAEQKAYDPKDVTTWPWEKSQTKPYGREFTSEVTGRLYCIDQQATWVIWVDWVKVMDPDKNFSSALGFTKKADVLACVQAIEEGELEWPQPVPTDKKAKAPVTPKGGKVARVVETEEGEEIEAPPSNPKSPVTKAQAREKEQAAKATAKSTAKPPSEKALDVKGRVKGKVIGKPEPEPEPEEAEAEATEPEYEMVTVFRCTECGEVNEDAGSTLYECGSCGEKFNRENSKNNRNACPSCGKMGSKVNEYTGKSCTSCEVAEVEEVEAFHVLESDEVVLPEDWEDYVTEWQEQQAA